MIAKNVLAVVLAGGVPAVATAKELPKLVQLGADVVIALGLLHVRAPKDE